MDDVQLHWNFSQVGLKIIKKNSQVLPSVGWIVLYVFLLQGSGKDCIWNAKKDTDRARISGRSVVALVRGSNQAVKTHTVFSPLAASLGSFRLMAGAVSRQTWPGVLGWPDPTHTQATALPEMLCKAPAPHWGHTGPILVIPKWMNLHTMKNKLAGLKIKWCILIIEDHSSNYWWDEASSSLYPDYVSRLLGFKWFRSLENLWLTCSPDWF